MPLQLDSRVAGPVHVITAKGGLVAGPTCGQLEELFYLDSRRDLTLVVLNLSGLQRLDSIGLGLIVRTAASLRRRNGDLRLACPTPIVAELLHITRVATIFHTYPSEEAAIHSFQETPPTAFSDEPSPGHT